MLFLLDKHGNLVETNLIAQNTLQLKSNKNLNFNFFTLIREKIKIEDIITSTLQGKEFRVSIMVQPSQTIPVSLSASKLEKKGQFIGYIVLATDLSGEQKLNDEKRAYELEIKAMQSQMNPNFILNSLSSVNSLLDKGDDSLSKQYISKLADLFKMILEQTGEHLITVEEEIDILETYLQIEKQRFENKFTYEIQTAEDCELSLFEIPPMIVQPFVENAILHGFTRSDQNKLTIIFSGDEERFNIIVKDDGVGISTRKNMLQENNHRGIATIRERLSLYNKYSNGYQSTLTVVNNKDLDPSTTGTTVTISFKKNLKLVENLKLMAN
jgi:LytS/YehU family sensor histidine kinase